MSRPPRRAASARVNSGKSNTYSANVVLPIIGAKTRRATAPAASSTSAPAVSRVVVDEGSEGQRLDNFLQKVLKGAPKSLIYRIIRSGEVRVAGMVPAALWAASDAVKAPAAITSNASRYGLA